MNIEQKTIKILVEKDFSGERLDKALSSTSKIFSRTRIKSFIEQGLVYKNGYVNKEPSAKVFENDIIEFTIPEIETSVIKAQEIPLNIVYEDEDLIVIDKPAGMVVHPAPGNYDNTMVNALIAHCGESLSGIGGVKRPGIVHRIDKDTSGLLVIAKNDKTHNFLAEQFSCHSIKRKYTAICWGLIAPSSGIISGNIGRNVKDRKKMTVVKCGGKEAVTHYKTIKIIKNIASIVECRLETGRTHQIRVHMTSCGHSIIGDPVYGKARKAVLSDEQKLFLTSFKRQALHASELGFLHPNNKDMIFYSKLPLEINNLINILEI